VHSRFLGWERQLPLHRRHGERRRCISQLEIGPGKPRPGFQRGLDGADGVSDTHRLREHRSGLVRIARSQPGSANIAERIGLNLAVTDFAGYGQRLGTQVDGPLVLAQVVVAEP
jgi:hypothetical protein